jgi:hypothetical protein
VASLAAIRTLLGAFDDGRSIRTAAAMAGVSKNTAQRYRAEWLQGRWPEEIRASVLATSMQPRGKYGRRTTAASGPQITL